MIPVPRVPLQAALASETICYVAVPTDVFSFVKSFNWFLSSDNNADVPGIGR